MIVFLDENYICHAENGGNLAAVDVDHFDGKCPTYINGYRYIPDGHSWTAPDGTVYRGEMLSPWKPWDSLDAAQREYERKQLADMEAELADARAALEMLGVSADE